MNGQVFVWRARWTTRRTEKRRRRRKRQTMRRGYSLTSWIAMRRRGHGRDGRRWGDSKSSRTISAFERSADPVQIPQSISSNDDTDQSSHQMPRLSRIFGCFYPKLQSRVFWHSIATGHYAGSHRPSILQTACRPTFWNSPDKRQLPVPLRI